MENFEKKAFDSFWGRGIPQKTFSPTNTESSVPISQPQPVREKIVYVERPIYVQRPAYASKPKKVKSKPFKFPKRPQAYKTNYETKLKQYSAKRQLRQEQFEDISKGAKFIGSGAKKVGLGTARVSHKAGVGTAKASRFFAKKSAPVVKRVGSGLVKKVENVGRGGSIYNKSLWQKIRRKWLMTKKKSRKRVTFTDYKGVKRKAGKNWKKAEVEFWKKSGVKLL